MPFGRKQRKEKKTEFRQIFCRHCNNDFSLQTYTFKSESKSRNYQYGYNQKSKEDRADKLLTRIPLTLYCGHSVCEVCIHKEIKENTSIKCSQCNNICKIDKESKTNIRRIFPINYYYVGILYFNEVAYEDSIAFQPASSTQKEAIRTLINKELCAECRVEPVKWHCNECTMSFCVKCFGIVHKPVCFSHHKARPVEESGYRSLNISLPVCEKHSKKVQFYCVKCQEMLCGHCVLELHENHNIQELKVKNQESLQEFNDMVVQVKQILVQLKNTKLKLENEIFRANKHKVSRINERISNHFMKIHGRLQIVEKQLQKKIEERRELSKDNLIELQSKLQQNITHVENLLELSSRFDVPENVSQLNLLKLMSTLESALKLNCHLTGEQNSDTDFTELVINEQFMSLIDNHCSLIFPALKTFNLSNCNELSDDIETLSLKSFQDDMSTTASNKSFTDSLVEISSNSSFVMSYFAKNIDLEKQKKNHFVPGAFLPILVTHISSPSLFYIQHDDDSYLLSSLEQAMNKYAKDTNVPNDVKLNGVYFVQFEDNKWYRAVVKSINVDRIKKCEIYTVFYMDYGNEQNITIEKIRPINEEFLKYPPMAHKCCLFNISPVKDQWTKDAVRIMAKMLDGMLERHFSVNQCQQKNVCVKAHVTVMDVSDEILHVDLVTNPQDTSDLSASVRDALIFLNFGCFVKKIETERQVCPLNENQEYIIHQKDFRVNDEFLAIISHVNSPSSFYIQLVTHTNYLEDMMQNMKLKYDHYFNKGIVYTPKYGMICAVNMDSRWYRGRVIGLPGKKQLDVFLIDYGNIVTVDWSSIRKLYDEFLQFDLQAVHCSLSDVKPLSETWSSKSITYFTEIVQDKRLQVNINKIGISTEITISERKFTKNVNINALLVKKGLAISTGEHSTFIETYPLEVDNTSCEVVKKFKSTEKSVSANASTEPYRLPVKVLSATSPSCIYVCLQSLIDVIKEMQQDINRFYGDSKYEENLKWQVSEKCAIHSEIDDLWYRGIICECLPNDEFKVFIKDFARLETVKKSRLRQLDDQFLNVRDGAVKCHMWGIQAAGDRGEWPMLACEILQGWFEIYSNVFITKRGPIKDCSLPVDVWVEHKIPGGPLEPTRMEFRLLNQCLIDDGVVIPIKQETSSRFQNKIEKSIYDETDGVETGGNLSEWLKLPIEVNIEKNTLRDSSLVSSGTYDWLPPLPLEENVEFSAVVTYVDDNMNFYLYNVELEKSYEDISSIIKNCFETEFENIPWQKGQACIVQSSDLQNSDFYRAKVLDILNTIIEVQLVDYGSTLLCDSSDLRKACILNDLPIKVTKCKLYNVEPAHETWSLSIISRIREAVLCDNVTVIVKEQDATKSFTNVSICVKKIGDISEYLLSTNLAKLRIKKDKIIKLDIAAGNNFVNDSNENIDNDVTIEDMIFENSNAMSRDCMIEDDITVESNESVTDEMIFESDNFADDKNVILEDDLNSESDFYECIDNLGYRLIQLPSDLKEMEVTVVSLSSDDCCSWYVQPSGIDNLFTVMTAYAKLLPLMQQEAPNQNVITEPTVGQECVAKFKDDGNWYRGEIYPPIFKNKDDLFILFVDYGNIDTVKRSDVRMAKSAWINIPIQCLKCKLWNVKKSDDVEVDEFVSQMTDVLLNVKCLMKIKTKRPLQVEFLNIETGQLLYQSLINKNILQYD